MASTRKPAPAPEEAVALAACLARHPGKRVAIAYSGGIDSTALLHLLAERAEHSGRDAIALHVHHGLSPNADAWLAHCQTTCAQLGLPFDHVRLDLLVPRGASLEEVARTARYEALAALCARHGATLLLTAHHADDQAETVLLNLLRGSGMAGLAGMARERALNAALILARPLLDFPAEPLHAWVRARGLAWIDDESNAALRHARNAVRQRVLPVLRELFPAATKSLAQSAELAGEAQGLLQDVALQDLATCRAGPQALTLTPLRALSAARHANALRQWLREQGLRAPSLATLRNLQDQIARRQPATGLRVEHDGHVLTAYRDVLTCAPAVALTRGTVCFRWEGEERHDFPEWGGALRFTPARAQGISAAWLATQQLSLQERSGGERLRMAAQRPSRTLKNLYQEHGVPAAQRARLPLLYAGDELVMAAGLGTTARRLMACAAEGDRLVELEWSTH